MKKHIKKYALISTITCLLLALTAIFVIPRILDSKPATASAADTPSYRVVTEVLDWGPAMTKLIVQVGKPVSKGSVGTDTFKVHVVRTDPRPNAKIAEDGAEGDREITKTYVSDKDGNAADSGSYIAIEMKVGPSVSLAYSINWDAKIGRNSWVKYSYTVTQMKDIASDLGKISGLVVNKSSGDIKKLIDDFTTGSYTDNENKITLTYASYTPKKDNKKNPLIVWLHGTGEVGTDPTIPICANKSCYFASADMQSYFGGAYVLSPQSPTMWGQGANENALMALIKDYVAKNSDIDTSRIYVVGSSNGGGMTMFLARDYTDYFAAAVPICEAMPDQYITDGDIQKLKNIPIWFTAAKTDTVVLPDNFAVPTYKRLVEAKAKDVHFSYFDNVVDMTGLYKQADGKPFEYNGHFSHIYVFNNQCTDVINGKKTTIMQWLAAQQKK